MKRSMLVIEAAELAEAGKTSSTASADAGNVMTRSKNAEAHSASASRFECMGASVYFATPLMLKSSYSTSTVFVVRLIRDLVS